MTLQASEGEVNNVSLSYDTTSQLVTIDLNGGPMVLFGAHCTMTGFSTATCPRASTSRFNLHLGDLNDRATVHNLSSTSPYVYVYGDAGSDTITATASTTHLEGGPDNDALTLGEGTALGGDGDDDLTGTINGLTTRDVVLHGGAGIDLITGGPGNDTLDGGAHGDILIGGGGFDSVDYSARSEALTITWDGIANDGAATDQNFNGKRDDIRSGVEQVVGGSGADDITGGVGHERLDGGPGDDSITGAGGADQLVGGAGIDTIDASDGAGTDRVDCGPDTDLAATGDMYDQFVGCEAVEAPLPPAPTVSAAPVASASGSITWSASCSPGTWTGNPTFATTVVVRTGATSGTWNGVVAEQRTVGTSRVLPSPAPGLEVACEVIATNRGGSVTVVSEPIRVDRQGRVAPTSIADGPTVSGGSSVGQLLACDPGPWRAATGGTPAQLERRWMADGAQVATGATYELANADVGKKVTCQVADVGSAPNHPVTYSRNSITVDGVPWSSSSATVFGSSAIGSTLVCNPGTWVRAESFRYRWVRSMQDDQGVGVATGATGPSHVTTAEDAGHNIWCQVTAVNVLGERLGAPSTMIRVAMLPATDGGGNDPVQDNEDSTEPVVTPPRDRVAPAVKLALAKLVRVHPTRPALPLRFTCPKTEVRCRYASTLTVGVGRRAVVLGRSTALVARNQTRQSSLRLNAQGKAQIRRGVVRATLVVVVTDAAGNKRTLRRAVTLRRR